MAEEPTTLASEPAPGMVIGGRYRVVRALGQGGMGAVYEAEHVDIEKRVALKVLHPTFAKEPLLRERFLREARAAARIGHPNVVDITDFGTTDSGVVFIVMELLEGRDLAEMLGAHTAIPWGEALPLLRQICGALAAAHALGIVHRDVKPENVFLVPRPDGTRRVKLVDFGIAKLLHDRNQPKLTAVGEVHGTPGYIAPEQITGATVDRRADVYAVGVMAYRMVTGGLPFAGDNIMQVLTRQLQETPAPPSEAARDPSSLPAGVDEVLLRAIARQPGDRFDSMDELASALEALAPAPAEVGLTLPPVAVDDPGPTLKLRSRRNMLPLATVVVLLLGAAVAGIILIPRARREGPDRRADVYAVGVMAYRMVTGALPFAGDNIMQVLTRQLQQTPAPPSEVARDPSSLPGGIDDVLLRAIARQAEDRFGSVEELASALEALAPAAGEVGLTLPPVAVDDPGPTLKLKSRRTMLPLVALVVLLLGAAVAGIILIPRARREGPDRRDAVILPTTVDSGATIASRADGGPDSSVTVPADAGRPNRPPVHGSRRHRTRTATPRATTPGRQDSTKTNKTAPFKAKGDLIDPWHTAP